MAVRTFRPGAPVRMRVTALDACAVPAFDPDCTYYVRKCMVSLTWEDQIEDPPEYLLRCDDDEKQYFKRGKPILKFTQATLSLNDQDPLLQRLTIGTDSEIDAQTMDEVGFRKNTLTYGHPNFALEFWAQMMPGPATPLCPDGVPRWAYFLLPFNTNARESTAPTISNNTDAVAIQFDAVEGGSWDDGPFDVVADAAGDPAPLLDPMQPSQILLGRETTVAPPEITDGCVGLTSPTSPTSPAMAGA